MPIAVRLFDFVEKFSSLAWGFGLSIAVLITAVVLALPYVLSITSEDAWSSRNWFNLSAWQYLRDSFRWCSLAALFLIVVVCFVIDARLHEWRKTPTGFFVEVQRSGEVSSGRAATYTVDLPGSSDVSFVLGGIRLSATLERPIDNEELIAITYDLSESIKGLKLMIPATSDCFTASEFASFSLLAIVIDDGRNSTRVGVVNATGPIASSQSLGIGIGGVGHHMCGLEAFRRERSRSARFST